MLAQAAIKDGRVLVDGVAIKPAREARAGETVAARTGDLTRACKMLRFPLRRVAAPEVAAFAEDLTPPEAPRRLDRKPLSPGLFGENICRCTRVPAAGCRAPHQVGPPADRAAERPRVRRGCRNLTGAAMGSVLGSEPGARADSCARGRGP